MRIYSVRPSSLRSLCLALGVVGAISAGCADEDANSATAGSGGSSMAGKAGGGDGGSVGGGSSTSGTAVTYEVPPSGGTVEVTLPSGASVSFEFPASAQGETITLTPDTAESIGWTEGRFSEVI